MKAASVLPIDRDEAAIRLAMKSHSRTHDWDAFRLDLMALRDRMQELQRDDLLPRRDTERYLRRMTGQYLAHPDPAGWTTAAELIEATCDYVMCPCVILDNAPPRFSWLVESATRRCHEAAAIWRARARHFQPLTDHLNLCLVGGKGSGSSAKIGALEIAFTCRERTVYVQAWRGLEEIALCGQSYYRFPAAGCRYFTQRLVELIDRYRELLDAEGD